MNGRSNKIWTSILGDIWAELRIFNFYTLSLSHYIFSIKSIHNKNYKLSNDNPLKNRTLLNIITIKPIHRLLQAVQCIYKIAFVKAYLGINRNIKFCLILTHYANFYVVNIEFKNSSLKV